MKGYPVKPLEEALPGFRQFLICIRMYKENVKAFKAAEK
jgi:hypothetical protein